MEPIEHMSALLNDLTAPNIIEHKSSSFKQLYDVFCRQAFKQPKGHRALRNNWTTDLKKFDRLISLLKGT